MRQFWVYILASRSRRLYVGITSGPVRRLAQHPTGTGSLTSGYRIHRLVYAEEFKDPYDAISAEKTVKGWRRSKKVALIERGNPAWDDLAGRWFEGVKADPSLRLRSGRRAALGMIRIRNDRTEKRRRRSCRS